MIGQIRNNMDVKFSDNKTETIPVPVAKTFSKKNQEEKDYLYDRACLSFNQKMDINMDKYGKIWTNIGKYGQIQTNMEQYGKFMGKYGQILTNIDKYRKIQANMDKYGEI